MEVRINNPKKSGDPKLIQGKVTEVVTLKNATMICVDASDGGGFMIEISGVDLNGRNFWEVMQGEGRSEV
jgi:hypothetical protein